MDNLGDIRLFVEAAGQGSLSAAGRKLGLSPAAASARLSKLEGELRTQLFERTTRKLRLTEEGRMYLEHCQHALQTLDEEREPTDAIVRAWLGLQDTAAESGIVRGPAETPTEFTSRILGRVFADDRAVRTLLRLYLRSRFGDHPATATDVQAAREALQALADSWPAAASGRHRRISRSRPRPSRCSSWRCANRCSWGTTTSAPSTSCSA